MREWGVMTKAGLHSAIFILHRERHEDIAALGPRPSWFRPIARRAWDKERAEIGALYLSIAKDLNEQNGGLVSDSSLEHVWS